MIGRRQLQALFMLGHLVVLEEGRVRGTRPSSLRRTAGRYRQIAELKGRKA